MALARGRQELFALSEAAPERYRLSEQRADQQRRANPDGLGGDSRRAHFRVMAGPPDSIRLYNEEYVFNAKSPMLNSSFLDYRTPVCLDLPMLDTVIVEVPNPNHPYGGRGVGETSVIPPSRRHHQCRVPRHWCPPVPTAAVAGSHLGSFVGE
jgi:hypothetical protein